MDNFKRIGRIKAGEKMVVQRLAEDLQDMYDKLESVSDDANRAHEEWMEQPSDIDIAKKAETLLWEHKKAKLDFWYRVSERYGLWMKMLSIRDGYAIVEAAKPKEQIKKMKNFLDHFDDDESDSFSLED